MSIFDKQKSRLSFDKAASQYNKYALLQQQVAVNLLRHLRDRENSSPRSILDLGCGTGQVTEVLSDRYPGAELTALDFSPRMLEQTEQRMHALGAHATTVCADADSLPFATGSYDLIVSSLMLQWSSDLYATLSGINRVLADNGMFCFSSFSEGTLWELKKSWEAVDHAPHSSDFLSLEQFETVTNSAGFSSVDIVTETIVESYSSIRELLLSMKGIGASNAHSGRDRGLTGKQRFHAFERAYDGYRLENGAYPCTWEVTYVFCAK